MLAVIVLIALAVMCLLACEYPFEIQISEF